MRRLDDLSVPRKHERHGCPQLLQTSTR